MVLQHKFVSLTLNYSPAKNSLKEQRCHAFPLNYFAVVLLSGIPRLHDEASSTSAHLALVVCLSSQ